MATTRLGEAEVHTVGELPAVGSAAPEFTLTNGDFADVTKTPGKRTILDIFPTISTGVCQAGVRAFAKLAPGLDNTEIIAVSQDLPLAVANYCGAEGIEGLIVGSAFRSGFGTDYGITMADGNWRGLLARSVVVIDTDGTVLHTQLTPAIGTEPDYEAAVAVLR
ncbi:thiol peroxidase [Nocardioides agariphilus]|jgi:thiol peroxidase|uniref:Thiol peroxidase n=1 Tax=Nocardioides agariphilus TaxID=433664 RepID=A0A930VM27_9ACTN|nr:thiol peroxidase [Nocardioides agariphilus]MBF4766360.1 thiol peroxidase [Nocardioides agariphilus]